MRVRVHKNGEVRTKSFFALWPVCVEDVWYWLERVQVVYHRTAMLGVYPATVVRDGESVDDAEARVLARWAIPNELVMEFDKD